MNATSAKCGHVKRRLNKDEQLEGEVLEFALSLVEREEGAPSLGAESDRLFSGIAAKLKAGQNLDEYEHHIMVDVLLVHVKLAAASE